MVLIQTLCFYSELPGRAMERSGSESLLALIPRPSPPSLFMTRMQIMNSIQSYLPQLLILFFLIELNWLNCRPHRNPLALVGTTGSHCFWMFISVWACISIKCLNYDSTTTFTLHHDANRPLRTPQRGVQDLCPKALQSLFLLSSGLRPRSSRLVVSPLAVSQSQIARFL